MCRTARNGNGTEHNSVEGKHAKEQLNRTMVGRNLAEKRALEIAVAG